MTTHDRTTPEGAARLLQHCVRGGDVEGALSCFDEEAAYVLASGQVVRGTDAIREALTGLCNMTPDLQAKRSRFIEVGEYVALVDEWELRATLPDGTPIHMVGVSSDILRRAPDGYWAYLVDNPYGASILDMSPNV